MTDMPKSQERGGVYFTREHWTDHTTGRLGCKDQCRTNSDHAHKRSGGGSCQYARAINQRRITRRGMRSSATRKVHYSGVRRDLATCHRQTRLSQLVLYFDATADLSGPREQNVRASCRCDGDIRGKERVTPQRRGSPLKRLKWRFVVRMGERRRRAERACVHQRWDGRIYPSKDALVAGHISIACAVTVVSLHRRNRHIL